MTRHKLIFASSNQDKIREVQSKIPNSIQVISMREMGFKDEIIEDGLTIKQNAKIKVDTLYERYKTNCFGDDTGLMVDHLDGRPGVFSARYAGDNCSYDDNVKKLLKELKGTINRKAHFKTVISLRWQGSYYDFVGRIDGTITEDIAGQDGFGYDPIFKPDGHEQTFAEMSMNLKNRISHRAIAVQKLIEFIHQKSN